jgi:hypothetical protein
MWIERLATKANLEKLVFKSTNHTSFTDLSIFINPTLGKKLGLLGDVDGLRVLSETSAIMINFFNK